MNFIKKHKLVIIYGFSLAVLLVLLNVFQYKLLILNNSLEIYIGIIALFFMLLGIWITTKLSRPKKETVIVEKEKIIEVEKVIEKEIIITKLPAFQLNEKAISDAEISAREMEVLQLMAKGLTNQQIADNLYVSVNTIKTHAANLFFKLDVTRRTQAIEKAKRLSIIP